MTRRVQITGEGRASLTNDTNDLTLRERLLLEIAARCPAIEVENLTALADEVTADFGGDTDAAIVAIKSGNAYFAREE